MQPVSRRATWISLQRVSLADDGQGGSIETWVEFAKDAARVESLTVAEIQQAGALAATLTTALTIPYRPDVSPKDRIVIDDARGIVRTLQVENVENDPESQDPARVETRLLCTELQL